ncbi:hypothetical protein ACRAWD_20560 [Caulobacter segnis]
MRERGDLLVGLLVAFILGLSAGLRAARRAAVRRAWQLLRRRYRDRRRLAHDPDSPLCGGQATSKGSIKLVEPGFVSKPTLLALQAAPCGGARPDHTLGSPFMPPTSSSSPMGLCSTGAVAAHRAKPRVHRTLSAGAVGQGLAGPAFRIGVASSRLPSAAFKLPPPAAVPLSGWRRLLFTAREALSSPRPPGAGGPGGRRQPATEFAIRAEDATNRLLSRWRRLHGVLGGLLLPVAAAARRRGRLFSDALAMMRGKLLYGLFIAAGLALMWSPCRCGRAARRRRPDRQVVAPGPLSSAHRAFGAQCATCHTPLKAWRPTTAWPATRASDFGGKQSTQFHAQAKDCASCHVEHDGQRGLVKMNHHALLEPAIWRTTTRRRSPWGSTAVLRRKCARLRQLPSFA